MDKTSDLFGMFFDNIILLFDNRLLAHKLEYKQGWFT